MKKVKKVKNKKRNYKLIVRAEFLILAVLFAIGIYQVYTYVPGVKEAVALATTVKPETFTELYFSEHQKLPQNIVPYQPIPVEFTIHNLENKDLDYVYEVFIQVNGKKQPLITRSVFIKNNSYVNIKEIISANYPSERFKVGANLINKNQAIDFWVQE